MRVHFPRELVHRLFFRKTDRQLAGMLAFLSGAINVGAVRRRASNMAETVSAISNDLAIGFATTLPLAAGRLALAVPSTLQDLWAMENDSRADVP
ncbi:hypothetical protein VAPA_2c05290 [Variovorax paradoxus B4]|uniref:Uncharacterized protein n=2 Tax=Variovorax paradoxus TaxID=34073 RepID=T1XLD8_VARPD|nr:hypothetical protein VAPA_2c05290 [Variovorax paradoxus B4]